ncbi:helix-turn-helix transcriptional regulator [bacterium]|nr:helix-turn-helix transcriptional regulator [bacterium]
MDSAREQEQRIDNVKRYVEENICDIGSVNNLAARFGYQPSELYDQFKKRFETSPKNYILDCKMKKLVELLQQTGDQEIVYYYAHTLGFKTAAGITNFVKRRTGLNFTQFRERLMTGRLNPAALN